MMGTARERIEAVLREKVCAVCVERTADGGCGQPAASPCPLFLHLDDVIAVVASRGAVTMDDYIARLRNLICSNCEADARGNCRRRNQLECALEMYFPLIIDLIEKELQPQPA